VEVSGISKAFDGVHAVSDLSFSLIQGRIKAVIGPNGAGKTTLFNLLTGVLRPDTGEVRFSGLPTPAGGTHGIAALGIARTFQTPKLFASMTVLENVMVGEHRLLKANFAHSLLPLSATRYEEQVALATAGELLSLVGLAESAHLKVDTLTFGQRRLLEVARALAMRPRVLMLDEPAAGLNGTEKRFLGDLLMRLRDAGLTILLVEHDMGLVMRLADDLLVLDRGRKIAEGVPQEVRRDRAVIDAYLGSELHDVAR
jgi:ABC-type branched-subunit amino acid transport system ATPase component